MWLVTNEKVLLVFYCKSNILLEIYLAVVTAELGPGCSLMLWEVAGQVGTM